MRTPPTRFNNADDNAIREELKRHRSVLERKDEATGETTILCSCGLLFGPLPKAESVLDAFTEHFLGLLKGT